MFRSILAVFLAVMALAALGALRSEWRAFAAVERARSAAVPLGFAQAPPLPLSTSAQRLILRECMSALAPARAALLPPRTSLRLRDACGGFVQAAAARWPADAALALTRAHVETDRRARLAAVALSHRLAPYQGWMAERRLALLARVAEPPPALVAAEARSLLHGQRGAAFLARYYLRRPDMRPAIGGALARVEEDLQQRFMNQVLQAREGQRDG